MAISLDRSSNRFRDGVVMTEELTPKCRLCGLEDGACICAHLPPRSSAATEYADKSGLVEELDLYIKNAERYERGDTDIRRPIPAVTLKVLKAEINALAKLRETYSELFVENLNVVASRDSLRGRVEELEAKLHGGDNDEMF